MTQWNSLPGCGLPYLLPCLPNTLFLSITCTWTANIHLETFKHSSPPLRLRGATLNPSRYHSAVIIEWFQEGSQLGVSVSRRLSDSWMAVGFPAVCEGGKKQLLFTSEIPSRHHDAQTLFSGGNFSKILVKDHMILS